MASSGSSNSNTQRDAVPRDSQLSNGGSPACALQLKRHQFQSQAKIVLSQVMAFVNDLHQISLPKKPCVCMKVGCSARCWISIVSSSLRITFSRFYSWVSIRLNTVKSIPSAVCIWTSASCATKFSSIIFSLTSRSAKRRKSGCSYLFSQPLPSTKVQPNADASHIEASSMCRQMPLPTPVPFLRCRKDEVNSDGSASEIASETDSKHHRAKSLAVILYIISLNVIPSSTEIS